MCLTYPLVIQTKPQLVVLEDSLLRRDKVLQFVIFKTIDEVFDLLFTSPWHTLL